MKVAPDTIQISCPACATPVTTEVWRVVDVGQEPELKRRLLRGQLNAATCPSCSSRVAVATPLAYHDPEKELFLVLVPSQMGLSGEEQDKTIGELTNLLMNSLPAEQRKGYLFQPRTLFTAESLLSEVLRAEGVTDEMMQDQTQKNQLVRDLLAQMEDEASLQKLVEENKEALDYEFFLFLSASMDQARADGEDSLAEELGALREKLQDLVALPSVPLPQDMEGALTREELIERLASHKEDEDFETLIAVARPILDYQFFQTLTGQIEIAESQGENEKAQELTDLRTRILDLVDELDKEAKEALEQASELLREILGSEDMEAAAKENVERLDGAFLTALEANILAAQKADQQEVLDKLEELRTQVASLLEARLPPELRLINQLLAAPEPEERQRLLEEQPGLINEAFLKLLNLIVEDLRSQGQPEAAERLADTIPQLEAMLQEPEDMSASD